MKDKLEIIRRFLGAETALALATVDENCVPRTTPLFFLSDGDLNLYWFSSASSMHSKNCARNPSASVAVYSAAQTWKRIRGVQMAGVVARIENRQLRKTIAADYADRFQLGAVLRLAVRRSSLYCFAPVWARYIDNSKHFGYKFELRINP
jgi:uncharacterized protein YhbP (UPF0306 family)